MPKKTKSTSGKPTVRSAVKVESPQTMKLRKAMRTAFRKHGAAGLVGFLTSMEYIHEGLWSDIRVALFEEFNDALVVRVECGGGHTYLQHNKPHNFLPNDHPIMALDVQLEPGDVWLGKDGLPVKDSTRWAVCSGCGRPIRYDHAANTTLVLTSCPNLMGGTGVRLITQAVPVTTC